MTSKQDALNFAKILGCSGVHRDKTGAWMPCSSAEELERISSEAEPGKKIYDEDFVVTKRIKKGRPSLRKIRGNKFEELRERGIAGIHTSADGSLSSARPGDPGALF